MKHRLAATVLLILCAAGSAPDLVACGDKFLVPARSTRFHGTTTRNAAVLLYASDTSELSRMITKLSLAARLQKAGYRPTMARSEADFTSALAQGGWDVVVVDVSDRPRLADRLPESSGPAVLPVTYTLAGDQLKLARREYPALVKAPKNSGAFLDMIDTALDKHRAKQPALR